MKENIVLCIYLYPGSSRMSPQSCLHLQHLSTLTHFPWRSLTALVSVYRSSQSTLSAAWGMTPLRNTYMEMQLKAPFAE